MKQFFHQLRTSYAPLVADKSFNGLAQDDILFQFDAIHLHNSAFLHMPQKPCVHITKNGLAGARQNLFDSSFTNMIKKGHFGVIGKNARAELLKLDREMEEDEGTAAIDDEVADNNDEDSVHSDEGWGDDDDVDTDDDNMMALVKSPEAERKQQRKVVRDTMFKRRVASLLSNSNDEASFKEALEKAIVYLKHDKRGEKMTPGEINKRITLFIKSGLIHGELLRRFEDEVNSKKANRGNTTSHRTRDIETTKKVDNILQANPGQKFFVQAEGKATVGAPVNTEGRPFEIPADETPIPLKSGGTVAFRRGDFVEGITYRGLLTKTKPKKTKGNTNAVQSKDFSSYSLQWNKGMMTYPAGKISNLNKYNVVEVWLQLKELKSSS